jgi:hypothetical protein
MLESRLQAVAGVGIIVIRRLKPGLPRIFPRIQPSALDGPYISPYDISSSE